MVTNDFVVVASSFLKGFATPRCRRERRCRHSAGKGNSEPWRASSTSSAKRAQETGRRLPSVQTGSRSGNRRQNLQPCDLTGQRHPQERLHTRRHGSRSADSDHLHLCRHYPIPDAERPQVLLGLWPGESHLLKGRSRSHEDIWTTRTGLDRIQTQECDPHAPQYRARLVPVSGRKELPRKHSSIHFLADRHGRVGQGGHLLVYCTYQSHHQAGCVSATGELFSTSTDLVLSPSFDYWWINVFSMKIARSDWCRRSSTASRTPSVSFAMGG